MEERTVFQPLAFGSLKPGVRLNGIYEIESLIAQGGMGEVYRGFNIQTRDTVAIKMIRPEFSNDPEIFELFRREASILHNLAHEAIVRYFVFSVDPELRRAYLATEFVDGSSLTSRLSFGPLPLAEVRRLQKRVALALDAAHRCGVIHRDISPDNIILPGDDVRNAKVIDFGIARSTRRTEVSIIGGRFAGKYNYAAPEQFGLAGGQVTFKSDIYSFGLVLAAALRGRPIDMSGSEVEVIAKRRVVPDLSDIDPSMRPLLQQMLKPLPADRPESMAVVAAWEPREPIVAASRTRSGTGAQEPASGWAAAVLGAVIALASFGGAAYVFRDDIAQWGRSIVALAPSGAVKTPPVGEAPTKALPPLKPLEPTPAPTPPAQEATNRAEEPANPPPVSPLPAPAQAPSAQSSLSEPVAPPSARKAESSPGQAIVPGPAPKEEPATQAPAPPSQQQLARDAKKLADALVRTKPPKAPQSNVELPSATVGEHYEAQLPAFDDPSGEGLRLTASGMPEGMTFSEPGQGRGKIEGAPTQAGRAAIRIVATNHTDKTAEMVATIVVADRPQPKEVEPPSAPAAPAVQWAPQAGPVAPNAATASAPVDSTPTIRLAPQPETAPSAQTPPAKTEPIALPATPSSPAAPMADENPPQPLPNAESQPTPEQAPLAGSVARLEPPRPSQSAIDLAGIAGAEFSSDLPRFSPGASGAELTLHAEPDTPAGLVFADLGSGLGRISGTPTTPGSYLFHIVATEPSGLSAGMTVILLIAPAPAPTTPPVEKSTPVQSLSSVEKGRVFAGSYDGGECFLVKPLAGVGDAHNYLGVGSELAPFQRFEAAYTRDVGFVPQLSLRLITPPECPAIELLRPRAGEAAAAPRIELTDYRVGRNRPLAGTIANLDGRRLFLVLVDNDGIAYRLETKPEPGGNSATFSVPLTPDAGSIGPIQMVLAIASAKPLPISETFRSGALKSIAPALVDAARSGAASVDADFFLFVN